MIFESNSRNKTVFIIIFSLVLVAGLVFLVFHKSSDNSAEPEPVFCTMDAKMCPDGSYVGRTGLKCEFAPCPEPGNVSLPRGYTLDSYSVEKVLETSCVQSRECETPGEYLVQSRCPFTSMCLQSKCTVVCPKYKGTD
jgi:hypothetical protein